LFAFDIAKMGVERNDFQTFVKTKKIQLKEILLKEIYYYFYLFKF